MGEYETNNPKSKQTNKQTNKQTTMSLKNLILNKSTVCVIYSISIKCTSIFTTV